MESSGGAESLQGWVLVARHTTVRGGRGRLTARVVAPDSNPFRPGQILVLQRGEEREEFELLEAEPYRDRVILQLRGVETGQQASRLEGRDILLHPKDLVDLPEGTYYIFRLVGLEVRDPKNRSLGVVQEVMRTGGADLLVVRGAGDEEILIPFSRSICSRIDPDGGFIEIDPPEGLLDLDGI